MVCQKLGFPMSSIEMNKRSSSQELGGMIQVCTLIQRLVLGAEDIMIDLFPRWILRWEKIEPTLC